MRAEGIGNPAAAVVLQGPPGAGLGGLVGAVRRMEVGPAAVTLLLGLLVLLPLGFVGGTAVQGHAWGELVSAHGRLAIFNTLRIALSVAVLSVAGAVVLAWLVTRTDLPGRRIMAALAPSPLLVSPLFTGMAWILLAGPRAGWINAGFRSLTRFGGPLFDVFTLPGIVLVLTLHYIPYGYLLIVGALQGIDPGLENASRLSGASLLTTLRRVVFPVVTPAILSALLLIFTLACEHFPVVTLLGVTGKIPTVQYDIYSAMVEFPNRPGYAAAASLVLLALALAALGLYSRFTRRQQRFVTLTGKPTPPRLTRLGRWRTPALVFCVAYVGLAVVVPLLALTLGSLLRFVTPNLAPSLFTVDNYQLMMQRPEAASAFRNTLVYGVVAATAVVLLAAYVSHTVTRRRGRLAVVLAVLAMLPASLPSLTLGLGVLWAYVRLAPAIYGTVWILLLAYLTRLTPYGVRVLSGSMVQIDPELEHAARLSGSPARQTLRCIVLPLVWPSLIAAWTLVFTQVILEVSMTVLLYTAPTTTVAINIWFYNFGGSTVLAYSLSVVLAAVGFAMLLASNRLKFENVRALAA